MSSSSHEPAPSELTVPADSHAGNDKEASLVQKVAAEDATQNPISFALFSWVSPLLACGWKRYREGTLLQAEDLLELPHNETSAVSYASFHHAFDDWRSQQQQQQRLGAVSEGEGAPKRETGDDAPVAADNNNNNNPATAPLLKLLAHANRRDLLLGALFRVFQDAGTVGSPFILRELIQWLGRYAFLGEAAEPKWKGFVLAFVLFANNFLLWVFTNLSLLYTNKAFARMRAAMCMAVYEKTVKLDRNQLRNVGRIQQMHTSDTYKFVDMSIFMNSLWAAPFVTLAALIGLVVFVGWSGLLALAVLLILTPMQAKITSGMMQIRRDTMKYSDSRIQAVNEFCQGIRVVKFMGWEQATVSKVLGIREGEVRNFSVLYGFRTLMLATLFSTPMIVMVVVFVVAYFVGQPISPVNVFPTMAMINVLRQPLTQLPLALARIVDCNVGLRRINEYLDLPEKRSYVTELRTGEEKDGYAVVVENVTAVYEWRATTVDSPSSPGRGVGGRGGQMGRGRGGEGTRVQQPPPVNHPSPPSPSAGCATIASAVPKELRPYMGPVSVQIPRGRLTLVVGATGSGKSTLLDMMIGEALVDPLAAGTFRVATAGDVAYMTQEAWIMNTTVRNNILMGLPYDEAKYVETVNVCQLIPDLEQLAASDMTEIGERGINLSGGQKQRVAFARAVYSGRSVVLMDDPLSAVDSHVCTALFRRCIQGEAMSRRTRVLVTHQVQFLPEAEHIVVVDKCRIVFQGSYLELLEAATGARPDLRNWVPAASPSSPRSEDAASPRATITEPSPRSDQTSVAHPLQPIPVPKEATEAATGRKIMSEEHQVQGAIQWKTVVWYFENQGLPMVLLTFFFFTVAQLANVLTSLILSWWTAHTPILGQRLTDRQYILYFGVFTAGSMLLLVVQTLPFNRCMLNAARGSHELMLRRILKAPTSYFDTTPVGRILSRFSKDLDNLDQQIPWTLGTTYQLVFTILGSIGIMAYSVAWLLLPLAVLFGLFLVLFTYYASTNRAQKRLEAINRTPMAAIMNETLGGLPTLRAYGMIQYYRGRHLAACDLSCKSTYNWRLSQRWLSIRVQLLSGAAVLAAGFVFSGIILSLDRASAIRQLPTMALALTNSIAMSGYLGILTNLSTELESAMSSVERIKEYTDELPMERDVAYHNVNHDGGPSFGKTVVPMYPPPDENWPRSGSLTFEHASLRYRDGLPLVLRDLNFSIPHGAKIGVVGRTGSGKSTLMLALFRIVELATLSEAEQKLLQKLPLSDSEGADGGRGAHVVAAAIAATIPPALGRILLDGRDITTVMLRDLRNKITIIPQDPLLFAGTVRSNVDPFSEHDDAAVWRAIDRVGLRSRVEADGGGAGRDDSADGLLCTVAERGNNFSVGQRQLICLARALLKKCRLLLMDEATASVDPETDAMIQATVRSAFRDCTVLTIAHRLQTVIDCDAILVMDNGSVVEYDHPHQLLSSASSTSSSTPPPSDDKSAGRRGDGDDDSASAETATTHQRRVVVSKECGTVPSKGVFCGMINALGEEESKRMHALAAAAYRGEGVTSS